MITNSGQRFADGATAVKHRERKGGGMKGRSDGARIGLKSNISPVSLQGQRETHGPDRLALKNVCFSPGRTMTPLKLVLLEGL